MKGRVEQVLLQVVLVVLAVAGAVYLGHVYLARRAEARAEKRAKAQAAQAIRDSVAEMVRRTNAVADWDRSLDADFRWRVLTVELERLWLTERPILFVGDVRDIATADPEHYLLHVASGLSDRPAFPEELEVSVLCPKAELDPLLHEHLDDLVDLGNQVAVVAKIGKIEARAVPGDTFGRLDKVGLGECLGVVYVGSRDTLQPAEP